MMLGGVLSIAIAAPNLAWLVFPSRDAGRQAEAEAVQPPLVRALGLMERAGRVGVLTIPFFYDIALVGALEKGALLAVLAALSIYYVCWARYFAGGRHDVALYAPLLGIPLPMAVAPVVAFGTGAIVLHSIPLAAAALLLGASHIPLSRRRARDARSRMGTNDPTLADTSPCKGERQ
jgi:hypothetical protein